jgi:hypothetical protein
MSPQKPRRSFDQRVNSWLAEDAGETFRRNKWRFWFVALIAFQLLNAILTAAVFATGGSLRSFIGAIVLAVGALLAWLAVAFLHYSDGHDRQLARAVSALDSVTLIFVIAHFCFLLWTYGHVSTIMGSEAKYEAQAERYNARAEKVSGDNVQVAKSAENISVHNEKAERLRNDAAYQLRKAYEAGGRPPGQPQIAAAGIAPALSTATIELEKPEKPKQSSTDFLTYWDFWIRLANFGELALAAITLIVIRNRSAQTNTPAEAPVRRAAQVEEDFPEELDTEARTPAQRPEFATAPVSSERKKTPKTPKTHASFDSEGLKRLRAALKDISFRLPGHSFKVDKKSDAVWIRLMAANNGTQQTVSTAKAKLDILTDAVTMPRTAFRDRLENFLQQNGFEI